MKAARLSPLSLLFGFLCAVTVWAQTSPWDKPNPNSPWDKPDPNSPWNPNRPWAGPSPVGNWIAEYQNVPDVGQVTQFAFAVSEPTNLQCEKAANGGCYLRKAPDPTADWVVGSVSKPSNSSARISRKTTDGALVMPHPYFYFLEAAVTTLRASGNELVGQWTHGNVRGGSPNPVVWRKRLPRITRVKFISGVESETVPGGAVPRVQTKYDAIYWAARTPVYSPTWTVEVYGDNLWGHHLVHLPKDVDMVTGSLEPILDSSRAEPFPANVVGFKVQVLILGERPGGDREVPKATPGRKTLVINDVEIPFDLDIVGFPGEVSKTSRLLSLRYVELRDGKYLPITGELKHGTVFYIEAAFDAAPAQKEYVVKLDWGEPTGTDVRVMPSSDAKVYRSEAIRLQAPAAKP